MDISYAFFQLVRKIAYQLRIEPAHTVFGDKILGVEEGGAVLRTLLENDAPCMAARIGSVEMQAINAVYTMRNGLRKSVPAIYMDVLYNNAGFFPKEIPSLEKFTACYEEAARQLDCAAVLRNRDEDYFYHTKTSKKITYVDLCALEPYYSTAPWSAVLKEKRILVISPFAKTIRSQFEKRSLLFDNPDILPEFELLTIKAVQSVGDNTGGFDTWFDALQDMKEKMQRTEFDIALIGCGAYSFPLAAYAKQLGRKAVVVGGALQILFGIKGKRWDQIEEVSQLYNQYWTRPAADECPAGAENVEEGCYW